MNIDARVNSRVPVKTTVQVDTDTVRIKGVYFDFSNDSAQILIGLGQVIGEEYNELKVEVWSISGRFYLNLINLKPLNRQDKKGIFLSELETFVSSLIVGVHAKPLLRKRLLESGELVITTK